MSSIAARRANKRVCQLQPNGMFSRGTYAYPGANGASTMRVKCQMLLQMCGNASSSLACRTVIFAAVLIHFFKVFVEFSPSPETAEQPVPKGHILHSHLELSKICSCTGRRIDRKSVV